MTTIHESWDYRDTPPAWIDRIRALPSATEAVTHHRIAWEASLVVTR